MPGAPFSVAELRDLRHTACATPAATTRTFARCAEAVPVARRFVRDTLAGHPAACDAELLACELVTNAVQHATDAVSVTVAVTRRGAAVHVDVIDDGQTGFPRWGEACRHDERGRGLYLVNHIAASWGFLRDQGGTCVWFEITPPG